MKRLQISGMTLLALILFPFSEAKAQVPEDSSRQVKILTFNILHGATLKGDFDQDRINQALELNALFAEGDRPTILCGDLNARPESPCMTILFSEWTGTSKNRAPTYPSMNPVHKIDYILYRPVNRWRVIESRVICDTIASDHCAQLSVLELLPASSAADF